MWKLYECRTSTQSGWLIHCCYSKYGSKRKQHSHPSNTSGHFITRHYASVKYQLFEKIMGLWRKNPHALSLQEPAGVSTFVKIMWRQKHTHTGIPTQRPRGPIILVIHQCSCKCVAVRATQSDSRHTEGGSNTLWSRQGLGD